MSLSDRASAKLTHVREFTASLSPVRGGEPSIQAVSQLSSQSGEEPGRRVGGGVEGVGEGGK